MPAFREREGMELFFLHNRPMEMYILELSFLKMLQVRQLRNNKYIAYKNQLPHLHLELDKCVSLV